MDSTQTADNERAQEIFRKLQMPFPVRKLKLRILQYNREKTRALVCPSLTKSTVIDRLNTVCGPTGWTSRFSTQTMPNISRRVGKEHTIIQSGKVLITCQLEIYGLGVQESTGEMWADDNNASTSAEAQSLKRAAARFGVGIYLEGVEKTWLPVDGEGALPSDAMIPLPDYALLDEERNDYQRRYAAFKSRMDGRKHGQQMGETAASQQVKKGGRSSTPSNRQPASTEKSTNRMDTGRAPVGNNGSEQAQTVPYEIDRAYAPFRSCLGDPLLYFVIQQTKLSVPAGTSADEVRKRTVEYLSVASSSMKKIREMAQNIPEASLFKVMESCKIRTMTTIPTVDDLRRFHKALNEEYERHHQGRPGVQAA